jgi:hypothetical protein
LHLGIANVIFTDAAVTAKLILLVSFICVALISHLLSTSIITAATIRSSSSCCRCSCGLALALTTALPAAAFAAAALPSASAFALRLLYAALHDASQPAQLIISITITIHIIVVIAIVIITRCVAHAFKVFVFI